MRSIRASLSRPLAALLMSLFLVEGCSGWSVQPTSPEAFAGKTPSAVRIHRRDGSTETLLSPQFTADSLVGKGLPGRPARIAVAFADAQVVEARKTNAVGTIGAVLGGTLAVLGVTAVIALSTWGGPFGH